MKLFNKHMPFIDEKEAHNWMVGFVEGEGCFTIQKINGYKYPRFYVSQKDKFPLLIIQALFGNMGVSLRISSNGNYYLLYSSTNLEQNKKIVDFFDGKLVGKKKTFEKYKSLVSRKMNNS